MRKKFHIITTQAGYPEGNAQHVKRVEDYMNSIKSPTNIYTTWLATSADPYVNLVTVFEWEQE